MTSWLRSTNTSREILKESGAGGSYSLIPRFPIQIQCSWYHNFMVKIVCFRNRNHKALFKTSGYPPVMPYYCKKGLKVAYGVSRHS